MDELIKTVNLLQDVFSATGCQQIDLPQIVVVGSQSSGKSSVLEHVVGKSFLPRGSGVVTRCPLVLQLIQSRQKNTQEYAIFQHNTTKVFTDYQLIRKEIEEQTKRLAGDNKGICEQSINLKIYSSLVLNLTLVDLPGLTKVPVGDQPTDIEQQTRDLILKYIRNPNSIILAVSAANVDMATSDSLKIAKEVDPEGVRTLAVVTKLDIMDEGTDAWDMLSGRVIPVKLGIIGVVSRSQKDIMEDKSVSNSLKDEKIFFQKHYKSIAHLHGSQYLAKSVQSILLRYIKTCIPKLRETVNEKLSSQKAKLHTLGGSDLDKSALLLDLITKFSSKYVAAIKGNLDNIETKELYGGARINYVFQESFCNALRSIEALAGLTKTAILTAMQNSSGVSSPLFVPETAFELLVKRQIDHLRRPSLQCVDLIHEEMNRILQSCTEDSDLKLNRFPTLQNEICEVLTNLLSSRMPVTTKMVDHFIDVQLAYINTNHPDFLTNTGLQFTIAITGSNHSPQSGSNLAYKRSFTTITLPDEIPPSLQDRPSSAMEKANRDCTLIEELIKSYFLIVRKTVQDTVPKIIMHFLVNHVVDHLHLELVTRLYKSDADVLLQEAQSVIEKRKEIRTSIVSLEKANSIINSMTTITLSKNDSNPENIL